MQGGAHPLYHHCPPTPLFGGRSDITRVYDTFLIIFKCNIAVIHGRVCFIANLTLGPRRNAKMWIDRVFGMDAIENRELKCAGLDTGLLLPMTGNLDSFIFSTPHLANLAGLKSEGVIAATPALS